MVCHSLGPLPLRSSPGPQYKLVMFALHDDGCQWHAMLHYHQPCLPGQMSAKRDMRTEAKQLDGVVKVVVIQLTTCTWSSIPFRFRAPLALQLWRVGRGMVLHSYSTYGAWTLEVVAIVQLYYRRK